MDLLSHESWDSWVSATNEDFGENPPALELYAIMRDDSDRCPHCNITHPATKPLPDLSHQQCLACKGTFLERFEFREPSQSSEHEVLKLDSQTPDLSVFPIVATTLLESLSAPHRLEQQNPINIPYSSASSTTTGSGASSTTAVELMHSTVSDAPSSPWHFFHSVYKLYAVDRIPSKLQRLNSPRWIPLRPSPRISSAAYDPIVRTVVQLSIVCLFFGSIYAFILYAMFGKLEQAATGPVWMRNARKASTDTLWNPWIMLSLPLFWIIWGVFYFAIFIMAFLWRSGATNEPDENSRPSETVAYGPRVVTTLMFAAGTLYLGLVIVAVRKI
ncbi:hypothetical protein B0H13DRAFT_2399797 [Mycena leptocephala]|nr:hypothetical protein B0H13DRAFT_2399797 [Mycena leptocephala]